MAKPRTRDEIAAAFGEQPKRSRADIENAFNVPRQGAPRLTVTLPGGRVLAADLPETQAPVGELGARLFEDRRQRAPRVPIGGIDNNTLDMRRMRMPSTPEGVPTTSSDTGETVTLGERLRDKGLALRAGTNTVLAGIQALPNWPNYAMGAWTIGANSMLRPFTGRDVFYNDVPKYGTAASNASIDRAETLRSWMSTHSQRAAAEYPPEGLGRQIKYAMTHPDFVANTMAENTPQFAPLALPGGVGGKLLASGALAIGMMQDQIARDNADRVAAGEITQEQADALAAMGGLASGAQNVLLPRALGRFGGLTLERAASGMRPVAGLGSRTGAVAKGLLGEGAQGFGTEYADQLIQNSATGRPLTEGATGSAVLGALMEGPLGGLVAGVGHRTAYDVLRDPNATAGEKYEALQWVNQHGTNADKSSLVASAGTVIAPDVAQSAQSAPLEDLGTSANTITVPARPAGAFTAAVQAARDHAAATVQVAQEQAQEAAQAAQDAVATQSEPEAVGAAIRAAQETQQTAQQAAQIAGLADADILDHLAGLLDEEANGQANTVEAGRAAIQNPAEPAVVAPVVPIGGGEAQVSTATDANLATTPETRASAAVQAASLQPLPQEAAVAAANSVANPANLLPDLRGGEEVVMQNRDRKRAASVLQMQDIRRNPDPDRLGFSRDPNTGAPMISEGAQVPESDKGRADIVKEPDGTVTPVRYAVVEADSLDASHDADGNVNPNYANAPMKALNNGRTAGLQAAHDTGNAQDYVRGIIADSGLHGVSQEAIASKRKPILVRLFDPALNARSAKRMAEAFAAVAEYAVRAEQQAATLDVFGDAPQHAASDALHSAGITEKEHGATNRDDAGVVGEGNGSRQQVESERAATSDAGAFQLESQQSAEAKAESQVSQSGLFAPPTAQEHNRAAREAKDAERNGLGRDVVRPEQGEGDLLAGDRPEQSRIDDNAPKPSRTPKPDAAEITPYYSRTERGTGDERNLIIQHNLTAENLLHADRIGGLAVPSLAVTKVDSPLSGFGEITLLGTSHLADPKGYAKTQVFGADIYSPRYPGITYRLDKNGLKAINRALAPHRNEGESDLYSGGDRSGVDFLAQRKDFNRWADANGVEQDVHARETAAAELLRDSGAKEMLFQGFDYNGNRRYKAHTLENVVRELKKELRGGENYNYGVGSLRAHFTPRFRSIDAIRKAKGALASKEQMEAAKQEIDSEFFGIVDMLRKENPSHTNQFMFTDSVLAVMADAAKKGLHRAAKEYGINVGQDSARAAVEFMEKLRTLPTEYFEAKVLREVDLAEFAAAVVPKGVDPRVVEKLEKRGVRVAFYKRGDDADRAQVIRQQAESTQDALFSRQESNAAPAFLTQAADVQAAITKAYGGLLARAERAGLVEVHQTEAEALQSAAKARAAKSGETVGEALARLRESLIPVGEATATEGFFDPQTGKAFLIADALTPATAPGTFMHEVGIHASPEIAGVFDAAAALVADPGVNKWAQQAAIRMASAGETSPEEAAAYLVTAYENDRANAPGSVRRWVRDFIAAVKAWLRRHNLPSGSIGVPEIAAIARANARATQRRAAGSLMASQQDDGFSAQERKQFREAEEAYGGREAYEQAKADGKTKLNYGQWVQVRTPAFLEWFGDWMNDPANASKVVDPETGEPMVVYHGTEGGAFDIVRGEVSITPPFTEFQTNGRIEPGAWFSPDIGFASKYGDVGAYFIRAATPLRHEGPLAGKPRDNDSAYRMRGKGDEIGRAMEIAVFDPTQIKSATANNGDFSARNNNIMFSRAPANVLANVRAQMAETEQRIGGREAYEASGSTLPYQVWVGSQTPAYQAFAKQTQVAPDEAKPEKPKAAKPQEPEAPEPPGNVAIDDVTGIAHEYSQKYMREIGEDEITKDLPRPWQQQLAAALSEYMGKGDPEQRYAYGQEVVEGILAGQPPSSHTEALLSVYLRDLKNRQIDLESRPESDILAQAELAQNQQRQMAIHVAMFKGGSALGRALNIRRMLLKKDFSYEALVRRELSRNGGKALDKATQDKLREMADTIAKQTKRLEELEAALADKAAAAAFAHARRRSASRARADREWEDRAAAARRRIASAEGVKSRNKQAGAVMSPALLYDYATLGAYHIRKGAVALADMIAAIRADIGSVIDEWLDDMPRVHALAKKLAQGNKETPSDVAADIKDREPTAADVLRMMRALAAAGVVSHVEAIEQASKLLKMDNATVRQMLIDGTPSAHTRSEIAQIVSDIRKAARIEAEIERLEAQRPKQEKPRTVRKDSPEVAAKREELRALKQSLRERGEDVDFNAQQERHYERRAAYWQNRIDTGDYNDTPKAPRAIANAVAQARLRAIEAQNAFTEWQYDQSLKDMTRTQRAMHRAFNLLQMPRAIQSSSDLSALGRQGLLLGLGHPVVFAKAAWDTIGAAFSQAKYEAIHHDIRENPAYANAVIDGVEFTDLNAGSLTRREELFASRLLAKIPVYFGGGILRGSQRQYTAFLNVLRLNAYTSMMANQDRGAGKALAGIVNAFSGRGNISNQKLANMMVGASTVFYAPRFALSRLQTVVGQPIWRSEARGYRAVVAKEYGRMFLGMSAYMALLALAVAGMRDDDDDSPLITFDWRSSDFSKFRMAGIRLDPLAGLAQWVTLIGRQVTGETETDGKVSPLTTGGTLRDLEIWLGMDVPPHKMGKDGKLAFGSRNGANIIQDFLRSKLAPIPGAYLNWRAGETPGGDKTDLQTELLGLVHPLSYGDIVDGFRADTSNMQRAGITAAAIFGIGVQARSSQDDAQLARFNQRVQQARDDVRTRLMALPMDQWESALEAMRPEYGPLLDGTTLQIYQRDGKYGYAGEPARDGQGRPKLKNTRLASNYRDGANAMPGEEVNHIIPDNLVRHHPLMARAREFGFDLDAPENLLAMPRDPEPGRVAHHGDHKHYDAQVYKELQRAQRRLKNRFDSLDAAPPQDVLREIRRVQDDMRKRLESGDVPTKGGRLVMRDNQTNTRVA